MKKILFMILAFCSFFLISCGEENNPTTNTTVVPTQAPTTVAPTTIPTQIPTTVAPTAIPTQMPTVAPTTEGPVELNNTTVYAVGDSTLSAFSDSYYLPRYGYATQLANYFNEKVTINNLALSGRSSKSFLAEANYTTLVNSIKSGDYLLIGFGHNDEKSDEPARFTDASLPITNENSFQYSLYNYYVKVALDKGATPILCTPIVRADTANNYNAASGHITATGDYAEAIRNLASNYNLPLIDLTSITKNRYTELGYNEAIYYHAILAGKYDTDGTTIIPDFASVDKTHLNIYGAKYVAYKLAETLKASTCRLGKYVLNDIVEPTKENDLKANSSYVVPSYEAPALYSYSPAAQFTTSTQGWYGTAFGDCGGNPQGEVNGYYATETSTGVFKVGQTLSSGSNKGKFASGGDGFAFVFRQIEVSKNFTLTVNAKVLTSGGVKQAGFGLMLRDDCFINQNTSKVVVTSNYVCAGFLTNESDMVASFYRENNAIVKNGTTIANLYAVDDEAVLTITRVGQTVTTTIEYKGNTYTKTYYDFDFQAVDMNYMYLGMFANRGTTVEFTNVQFEITGESQGA